MVGVWLCLGSGVSGVDFVFLERNPTVGKEARCHLQAGRGNEGLSTNSWFRLQIVHVMV